MKFLNFLILSTLLFSGVSFLYSAPSPNMYFAPTTRLCSLYDDYQHIIAEHERREREAERQKQEKEKEEREKKEREQQEKS